MDGRMMRWLVESVRDNVLPLTSRCGLDCFFCSHRYNPPGVEAVRMRDVKPGVLRDLLPLLDPDRVLVLGESVTRFMEGDPFLHTSKPYASCGPMSPASAPPGCWRWSQQGNNWRDWQRSWGRSSTCRFSWNHPWSGSEAPGGGRCQGFFGPQGRNQGRG